MNLKEAVETLGVERVQRAMPSFQNEGGDPETCFVGRALNDQAHFLGMRYRRDPTLGPMFARLTKPLENQAAVYEAASICEKAYEEWRGGYTRQDLYEACLVYLAENGQAVERTPVVAARSGSLASL